jgi:alkanesulfonate monooxygenase SsuD/methylene tetrahydromethanopterin reductase-like flavin-dependent oxidoreductase (luciferase family)
LIHATRSRAARDAGFASLWFPHHWLTHPMQMLQITPVMGYVAVHAQGMTIGTEYPDPAAAQPRACG